MTLDGFLNIGPCLRSGVYALVHNSEVVYVGKSKSMLSRIANHRSLWASERKGRQTPSWLPIKGIFFDDVWIKPCASDKVDAVEAEMIRRYHPKHNVQLKTREKQSLPPEIIAALKKSEGSVRRV